MNERKIQLGDKVKANSVNIIGYVVLLPIAGNRSTYAIVALDGKIHWVSEVTVIEPCALSTFEPKRGEKVVMAYSNYEFQEGDVATITNLLPKSSACRYEFELENGHKTTAYFVKPFKFTEALDDIMDEILSKTKPIEVKSKSIDSTSLLVKQPKALI